MPTQLESWLQLTREDPIDPEVPVCDPHHHLWDYPDTVPEERVPFFARQVRHYLLKDLLLDTGGGHNITNTVFIQCSSMYRKSGPPELRCVGETEFVQGIAAQSASGVYGDTQVAAGIVGDADLTLGTQVARVLEAQLAASPNRFRGIRYITIWDPNKEVASRPANKEIMADRKFREGFAQLKKYGLSFDAIVYHPQLMDLAALANAFPDTPVILNHIGWPLAVGPYAQTQDKVFRDWRKGIEALSRCANVTVKLGGLGMATMGFGWHERPKPPDSATMAAAMAPYLDWCIEKFGAGRCMFESNFPVDKSACSYTVLLNAFKRYSAGFSASDRAALFHDTAVRVYRL